MVPFDPALRERLASLGLPPGLVSHAVRIIRSCDSRLWLLDNSSRMRVRDGRVGRTVGGGGVIERVDDVARWKELQECVAFHSRLASECCIPTRYWLVNDPASSSTAWKKHPELQKDCRQFGLCCGDRDDVAAEMRKINRIMCNVQLDWPQCPLTSCIRSLSKGLAKKAPAMSERGRHVTLVMCTQGKPVDKNGKSGTEIMEEFRDKLSSFAELPVRVVVRLCTDNEFVRGAYHALDSKFDSIDVLDDYWGESREVYLHNPWLTYTMGLHRLREMALAPQVVNRLDEEPLSLDEIHQLCKILFLDEENDNNVDPLPHPQRNWDDFLRALASLIENDVPQWNPIKRRPRPWLDLGKLEAMHGGGESSRHFRHSLHKSNNSQSSQPPVFDDDDDTRKGQTPRKQTNSRPSKRASAAKTATNNDENNDPNHDDEGDPAPTLPEVIREWSRRPPEYESFRPLPRLLATVPLTFPPTNSAVEPHEYFARWKTFDEEAFADQSGEELKELLKRALRKAKLFLHPDKQPNDLTDKQRLLFDAIWHIIRDREAAYML